MALSINERVAATLFDQSGEAADLISHAKPLMKIFKDAKREKSATGGTSYRKPIRHNQTYNGGFYRGLGNFDFELNDDLTSVEVEVMQAFEPYVIEGREIRANRSSKHRLLDLVKEKNEIAFDKLGNLLNLSLMGDGTAFDGLGFDGIQKVISAAPTTGTYGGIDRSAYSVVQNVKVDSSGLTQANIQSNITTTAMKVARDGDMPDYGLCGATAYNHLFQSLTAIQRLGTEETASGGFNIKVLNFNNIKFYFDGGYGNNSGTAGYGANTIRLINSKYFYFFKEKGYWMTPLSDGKNQPVDNDGVYNVLLAEGNLLCVAPNLQALIV